MWQGADIVWQRAALVVTGVLLALSPSGSLAGGRSSDFEPALPVVPAIRPVSPTPAPAGPERSDTINKPCVAAAISKAFERAIDSTGEIGLFALWDSGQVSDVLSSCASGPGVDQWWLEHVRSSELMVAPPSLPAAKYVYEAIEKERDNRMAARARADEEINRRKEQEIDQQTAADKKEEDTLSAQYRSCVGNHADMLALASDELAEVVAKAAMASCPNEQLAYEGALTKHGHSLDLETRQEIEKITEGQLLLRVMAARAAKPPQEHPAPEAAPAQTSL